METCSVTVLPSGIRVVSENLPYVKSFSLGFWFDAGSRNEKPKNNGISHFIEHMFFKGTKKRSARKISLEIESLGGYLNAFTSKEQTCYYGRGPARHIGKTFQVLADMVQNPLFKESDMRKEAPVIIDELNDIEDSPEELIFEKFETQIFAGNSIAMPIIGTKKNIAGFTPEDLFKFIDGNYGFENFYIIASGAVNHHELVKLTEKYITKQFGKASRQRKKFRNKVVPDLFVKKDIQQAHMIIGAPTYGLNNSKRMQVNILSNVLGEGSSSRLFQRLREKNGIAYHVNSFVNSFLDTSAFGVYLSTNDKFLPKAVDLIYDEFQKLKNKPIPEKELRRAKEYFKGNILLSLENTTNRMLRIGQSVINYGRLKPLSESMSEIDSITTGEISEMAEEILNESELTKIVLSSQNKLSINAA